MAPKRSRATGGPSVAKITDSRFSKFETDPRFRLPSTRKHKVKLDKRYARVLEDEDFINTTTIDRFGRKLKSENKKKALKRLYRLGEDDDDEKDDEEASEAKVAQQKARRAEENYDPARGGGFSTSDSESDTDSEESELDENDAAEVGGADDTDGLGREQPVLTGEVTNRLAVVNLDWDHINSVDLMAVFTSFAPNGTGIEKIAVYASDFGKERMRHEDLEGPPREIFKGRSLDVGSGEDAADDDSSESDNSEADSDEDAKLKKELLQEGDDQDYDSNALRSYQLDRLRYYYAIMTCSGKATAKAIYDATDGKEYQASSNFIDLRFVPDDTAFDDEPRDECSAVPEGYRPVEFTTHALQHSKVKLTWDMHPEEVARKDVMKRAFTGSRDDIAENDLMAYLASDSEDDAEEEAKLGETEETERIAEASLSKKELARRKMREALGLSDEPAPKSSEKAPVGGLQIKFIPALSEKRNKTEAEEETTVEKYIRKEKERKNKRRDEMRARRNDPDAPDEAEETTEDADQDSHEELGFDDPFFTTEEPEKKTKSAMRKEERLKKRQAREADEKQNAEERARLELALADDLNQEASHTENYDMKQIIRAEKKQNRKSKRKEKESKAPKDGLQEGFKMTTNDPRFSGIFQDPEFGINPSDPKFEKTEGMLQLLREKQKRKQEQISAPAEYDQGRRSKKLKSTGTQGDLTSLAASIKAKHRRS